MAKQKNKQVAPVGATVNSKVQKQQPAPRATKSATENGSFISRYAQPLVISGIALLTFFFLRTCLDNKFTNWDDLGYIITDPLIKNNTMQGVIDLFKVSNPVMGNYHPLTILLYNIEYGYVGLQPWLYHFDSLICHILVTIAVYFFVKKLTGRMVAAGITALLFGLHPMHIESVAWAAGRKDLIYGLFYVMACTCYINYVRIEGSKRNLWYTAVVVLFALSLLAKSVGVTLPIALFFIDYFENRKLHINLLLEKIPLFALSMLFGVLSIYAQKDIGALGSLDAHFTALERFALGNYALFNYLLKAVVPTNLTHFYPYPLQIGGSLPASFYVYPLINVVLIGVVWMFARKNKLVLFGLAFFLVNIVLLLQFIPVGGAIMSDRYGYIPYLGFFLIIGWLVSGFFESKEKMQIGKLVLVGTVVYGLVLGYLSSERCKDWYDSVTIWKDNIAKHPEGPVGYFYLGQEYYSRYETAKTPAERKAYADSALLCFNASIERKPDYTNPMICLGELDRNEGHIDDAKNIYYKALKISEKNESAYLGLGVVYAIKQKYDSADYCFKTALKLKAYFPEGYSNYANFLDIIGKTDSSLIVYGKAIEQNPDAYIPYMNRAKILIRKGKPDAAVADYQKVMEISPELGEPYYLRSRVYAQKGNKALALKDVEKAISLSYPVDQAYYQQLKQP